MFATLITLALFAAPALNGVAAFDVNTPELVQCSSAPLSWAGTKGPYNLILVSPNDPCGDILADLGDHPDPSIHWVVDFPAGTHLMLSIEDANGDEGWSGNMTVAASSNTTCLNNAAAASSKSDSAATGLGDATVQAAGAAVTGGGGSASSDDPTAQGALGASSGSGASALHMSPIMALSALFVAAALL
ncbi:hypothetical protein C8R46DRAFT_1109814 [Mycena filopes]|nr:hypothetical protein C8R46DRAFT_1109814 [Mycena filopes]